jgi:hypothetical protein
VGGEISLSHDVLGVALSDLDQPDELALEVRQQYRPPQLPLCMATSVLWLQVYCVSKFQAKLWRVVERVSGDTLEGNNNNSGLLS